MQQSNPITEIQDANLAEDAKHPMFATIYAIHVSCHTATTSGVAPGYNLHHIAPSDPPITHTSVRRKTKGLQIRLPPDNTLINTYIRTSQRGAGSQGLCIRPGTNVRGEK